MLQLLLSLFLFADPYWVSKPPPEWSDAQLTALLTSSPWAQAVEGPGENSPPVEVFLATAGPIQLAEKERERRIQARRKPGPLPPESPGVTEYRLWLEDNLATQIIVAIPIRDNKGFLDEREVRRMEDGCVMRAGKKKIRMTGSFPPSEGDPYLRLAFPRQVELSDKTLFFDLYLPGVPQPFRTVEFTLKDMVVAGKLEL
ncbi:MAG TPA: hypothetical protein VGG72_21935 [Bryobacteraceae bacterium]|jgi:hypothetical protein